MAAMATSVAATRLPRVIIVMTTTPYPVSSSSSSSSDGGSVSLSWSV